MSRIKNAIIVHGPGRSGTTLLNNILSLHPDLSWISGYQNKFPAWPVLAYLNRLQSVEGFERVSRDRRYFPRPGEVYDFWDHYAGAVRQYDPIRIESMGDLGELTETLKRIMRYQGKNRLIVKLTGLARGTFINKVFENPLILYIDRDPRDVIVSYFRQQWLYKGHSGFSGLDRGKLLHEYVELFMRFYDSKSELKSFDFKQVKYESLVGDPVAFFADILKSGGLTDSSTFYEKVGGWNISSDGIGRWKSFFNERELATLDTGLEVPLKVLGYKPL